MDPRNQYKIHIEMRMEISKVHMDMVLDKYGHGKKHGNIYM